MISGDSCFEEVTNLYLMAGKKAMRYVACEEALDYFRYGIDLLDENRWNRQYKLSLDVHCNAAKLACYLVNYEEMKEFIDF